MELPTFPNHLSQTKRQWKQRKRQEFKKVLQALDVFRLGCAYTPTEYNALFDAAQRIQKDLSLQVWGR